MNLYTGHPYWLMKDGMIASYPSLKENITVDIAIVGAGISGALMAYYLRNKGYSIAVVDKRHAGLGSTAASTAFLQYEIDTPLRRLRHYVGEQNAVRSYKLCREAIYELQHICDALKPSFDFHIRPSLQYASYKKDVDGLHEEYLLRRKHGFEVKWLGCGELQEKFGIQSPGGILSRDGGEVDAYMLTHALLQCVNRRGHSVYNNTGITDIDHHPRHVLLHTDGGYTINARKVVMACGYESLNYLQKKVADIHTTYAIVSEPITTRRLWHGDSLVWETASPYLYFRKVNGDRVLVGGKDDPFHHPLMPQSVIKRKAALLVHDFNRRIRGINISADLAWGGAFAVTKDGLPYIGYAHHKDLFFALGFGGNGITFSIIAAKLLAAMLGGKASESDVRLFGFGR